MSLEAEIAFEDQNWLHLRATKRVSLAFSALNVFVKFQTVMDVNPNAIIRIPKSARFENYTSSFGQVYSAGAFSYSQTPITEAVVGRYCSIAHEVSTMGERHPIERVTSSSFTYSYFPHAFKPQFLRGHELLLGNAYPPKLPEIRTGALPVLEHDVWIGQRVILARGIRLGTGSVVGAGSVVTKDVAPYSIVAGNPARPIGARFDPELRQRLMATEWWNFHPKVLYEFGFADVEAFCRRMEEARAAGTLTPLPVRALTWKDVLEKIEEF